VEEEHDEHEAMLVVHELEIVHQPYIDDETDE